jgi:hypothetical protein
VFDALALADGADRRARITVAHLNIAAADTLYGRTK